MPQLCPWFDTGPKQNAVIVVTPTGFAIVSNRSSRAVCYLTGRRTGPRSSTPAVTVSTQLSNHTMENDNLNPEASQPGPTLIRAAQYVRMSTEHQQLRPLAFPGPSTPPSAASREKMAARAKSPTCILPGFLKS